VFLFCFLGPILELLSYHVDELQKHYVIFSEFSDRTTNTKLYTGISLFAGNCENSIHISYYRFYLPRSTAKWFAIFADVKCPE